MGILLVELYWSVITTIVKQAASRTKRIMAMNHTPNSSPSGDQVLKPRKRRSIFLGIGALILIYLCSLTNLLDLTFDFYAGRFSIDDIILTDELDAAGYPINRQSKNIYRSTQRINAVVYTTGIDTIIGMRWYHEDTLLFEHFERTAENHVATYIEGSLSSPLPRGKYHVDILKSRNGSPLRTLNFTVEEFELEVVPPQPTPVGHFNIENAPYVEVPFVFDEKWTVEGQSWRINEVKIVFLQDTELFAVVAETDLNPLKLSEEEMKTLAKPIALYAIRNGYLDQARQLQINGKTYSLDEPLAIILVNPELPGQGNRARFDINELHDSS
jgi:hypothetical protein